VEANVVAGVEKTVESIGPDPSGGRFDVHLRMLGQLTMTRAGVPLALPPSRKIRALIAYLALAPNAVTRSELCELLWDVPNDPRGELRWCLSKIRGLLDEPSRPRVQARGETIRLDLADCFVDVIEISKVIQSGIETVAAEQLRSLCSLFTGDFLDGLEIDRCFRFNNWLVALRRRFGSCHIALLERLATTAAIDDVFGDLDRWLDLAPFDQRAHERLLTLLAQQGRLKDGEDHVAGTVRLFDAEGLDSTVIREIWRAAKTQPNKTQPNRMIPQREISTAPKTTLIHAPEEITGAAPRRATVAVMPFVDRTVPRSIGGGDADGLAHDIITRLAKLRSVSIIAQGTVFALQEHGVSPEMAGRMLNVDYVVSGSLQPRRQHLSVTVELAETRTARIVWTEVFTPKLDEAFLVQDEIGDRIVASIASEIETIERNRAILKPPNSLDAWEAHHRGLWHMYRFNAADNARALHFFQTAVRLDPTFARAYAGLSFTHFQNAFQGWAGREQEADKAFEAAGQSLMIDDHDPAAHWAMGRALWLRARQDQSLSELERAVDLSPNFALGYYTLAFVHSQSGDPQAAIRTADYSRHLSPFDPLLFGMLATRAMALIRLGQFDEAAEWAVKAATRPNAHAHIQAIAAYCLALANRRDEARSYIASIHRKLPHYDVDDLLAAFRFGPDGIALFRKGAQAL
jgi:DNA-binding SARP family transcriptional activator/TolB-like protein/Flp pilus assembly protein TadD